ncbi:hypothetical protein C491_10684 [Natronococcus amylolyticus DSM 10524]|uniref:PRC-barrel domain-containing protein n=1 Tax=Natronococcus amylolyticus DSM 10524 TaxID=1227497 RepID=L9X6B2_9EURY|nr:hypothetical protein [Natronococcus amylolyticus]ELY57245.1 hypothetical protein C491_10684 [Natronococcus amylolyticus DSM 10524]
MRDDTPPSESDRRRITTDPERIREWAEARNAVPVTVHADEGSGYSFARRDDLGADRETYTWEEFLERFGDEDLVFVYRGDEPTGEGLGEFDLVDRETALERAARDRSDLEDELRREGTVTTEVRAREGAETRSVERDALESEVVDTEIVDRELVGSELLDRTVVDTEFVGDDVVEVTADESRLETIEEVERYTVESRVADGDGERDDAQIDGTVLLEAVRRAILDGDVLSSEASVDEIVDRKLLRSEHMAGPLVRSELFEHRTAEERVDERIRRRFALEDTELLDSAVVDSDVLEGEFVDAAEYEATAADGVAELSEDDRGKDVVDERGEQVGIVTDVEGGVAYVDPEPGLTDRLKAKLNWLERDDDDRPLERGQLDEITDDELVVRRGLENE